MGKNGCIIHNPKTTKNVKRLHARGKHTWKVFNQKKVLHKTRVQPSQDWFHLEHWPPFHCWILIVLEHQYGSPDVMSKRSLYQAFPKKYHYTFYDTTFTFRLRLPSSRFRRIRQQIRIFLNALFRVEKKKIRNVWPLFRL